MRVMAIIPTNGFIRLAVGLQYIISILNGISVGFLYKKGPSLTAGAHPSLVRPVGRSPQTAIPGGIGGR